MNKIRIGFFCFCTLLVPAVFFLGCSKSKSTTPQTTLSQYWNLDVSETTGFVHKIYTNESASILNYYPASDSNCEDTDKTYQTLIKKFLNIKLGKEISPPNPAEKPVSYTSIETDPDASPDNDNMDSQHTVYIFHTYIEVSSPDNTSAYYKRGKDVTDLLQSLQQQYEQEEKDKENESKETLNPNTMLSKKPILYLYPEKKEEIYVTLNKRILTTVYPEYHNGWHVQAEPDGKLHTYTQSSTGKEQLDLSRSYYALYYEAKSTIQDPWMDGFIVNRSHYQTFLENKLSLLGLNDRESEEFIVYWLPILQKHDKLAIRFLTPEQISQMSPMEISPRPDTLIRICMNFKEISTEESLPVQKLHRVKRKGFTAVEWGGLEEN